MAELDDGEGGEKHKFNFFPLIEADAVFVLFSERSEKSVKKLHERHAAVQMPRQNRMLDVIMPKEGGRDGSRGKSVSSW